LRFSPQPPPHQRTLRNRIRHPDYIPGCSCTCSAGLLWHRWLPNLGRTGHRPRHTPAAFRMTWRPCTRAPRAPTASPEVFSSTGSYRDGGLHAPLRLRHERDQLAKPCERHLPCAPTTIPVDGLHPAQRGSALAAGQPYDADRPPRSGLGGERASLLCVNVDFHSPHKRSEDGQRRSGGSECQGRVRWGR
jgi:hypothetical protein